MAERDEKENTEAPPPAKTGKAKAWLLPALFAVGALVLGAGGYFAGRLTAPHAETDEAAEQAASAPDKGAKKKAAGKDKKADKHVETRKPIYWAVDPAFVVNYQDSQVLRFLQVGVQVMAYDQETVDLLKANDPLIRNALLMLFSDQSYEALVSRDGKEKLRELALAELRRIVSEHGGNGPEAVYFTSFVMQ